MVNVYEETWILFVSPQLGSGNPSGGYGSSVTSHDDGLSLKVIGAVDGDRAVLSTVALKEAITINAALKGLDFCCIYCY